MQALKTVEACQRGLEENPDCLLAFSAQWCGPCKRLKPFLEKVTELQVLYVDVDDVPEFAEEFDVKSIPTVILIRDNEVITQTTGCTPKKLLDIVREY
jgi:thioredoxin 1